MAYRALPIILALVGCSPVEDVDEQTQAAVAGTTVISLTFDDTFADNFQVGAMAEARGMRATFFVNSGRIGQSGSLSLDQLIALRDAGHEIAGHTITHADLEAADTDEAKRQICNDRESFLANGFRVTSFAYPFSAENAKVRQLAAECGYNSARLVGGLVVPGSCSGCPYANPMPPVDPMAVRANDSVDNTTTLDRMKLYVTQAEQNGGGWVPMVFHHVCDGCNELAVTPAQLAAFLDWLKPRAAQGTVVATVDAVMGGTVKPAVAGPRIITNMLQNASLETDANNDQIPDCWKRDGYGTNSATYSFTSSAYSGARAQKLDVTSFSSGGRRLVSAQDSGTCAPAVIPGHRYTITARYTANAQPIVSVYLRNSSGSWSWFAESARLPTSSSYALATYTTPAIPAGTTHISVGLSLISTGSLTTDQYTLVDANDGSGPNVALSLPAANTTQRGLVEIFATATDPIGVDRVEFLVNGSVVGTDATYPYWVAWNSAALAGQTVTVAARAYDVAGNASTSSSRQITIQGAGDTTPPTVSITSPANGAQVSGTVFIDATASDAGSIARVEFFVNGTSLGSDTTAPYSWGWNSVPYNGQTVTLTARAFDNANNATTSAARTVTVTSAADTTPPIVSLTSPANGAAVSGTVTLSADAVDPESGINRVEFFANGTLVATEVNAPYELPWDTTPYAGQTVTLTARATDNANNVATSNARTITVTGGGSTAVAISSPPAGPTVSGTITVSASASDPDGIARVEFYANSTLIGSDQTSPYAVSWNTTPYSNQTVSLTARMVDNLNNVTTSAPRTVGVEDTQPPTVVLLSPGNGTTVSGSTVGFAADASDSGGIGGVEFSVNGTVVATDLTAPYGYTWDSTPYAGQTVTVRARAWDSAGNTTTTPGNVVTVGDPNNPPPVVNITSPADQATVTRTITITADASDADGIARVEFYVQAGGALGESELMGSDTTAPYSFDLNTDPYAGQSIILTAKAIENTAQGKATISAPHTVNVQAQAWAVALTSPANGATVNGTVTLTANASHGDIAIANVEFWANGTLLGTDTTAPYSLAWNTSAFAGQSVTLYVRGTDTSGASTASANVTVTVGGSTNMIRNPSLEADANGDQVPDCWQRGGSGTNSATYTLTSNAFAGSVAQRIDVTSLSSGARRIVTLQDSGTCAPAAAAGKRYTVTARYIANATTVFTVYYRNSAGSWVWLAQSANQPTSSTYRLGTYTTPTLPAGATHISVGLSIIAVGSVTMDDFTLSEAP